MDSPGQQKERCSSRQALPSNLCQEQLNGPRCSPTRGSRRPSLTGSPTRRTSSIPAPKAGASATASTASTSGGPGMTPRPANAPAAIAATPAALRATAVATIAAACFPPGDQATSKPTTTDAKWGQFRPSRRGHAKSSFSPWVPTGRRTAWRSPSGLQRRPRPGALVDAPVRRTIAFGGDALVDSLHRFDERNRGEAPADSQRH